MTMAMASTPILVVLLLQSMQFASVVSQPADLGALSSGADIPISFIPHSSPAETERIPDLFVMAKMNYTFITPDGRRESFSYPKEVAKYGEGQIFDVTAELIHITDQNDSNDHKGCSDGIRGSLQQPLPTDRFWIALIQRGVCRFEEKVQNVYKHNAIGAIIYNHHEAENLDKMKIEDRSRNITAVFTNKTIGERLAALIEENSTVYISITRGRYIKPIPSINRTSVLFVSISFIVLMIISFVWLVFYYVQRFRYLQTKDRKSRQLCTVAKRVIARIPTKNGRPDDDANDSDADCCAICIEPYKITDVVRVLPCKHEFHKSCIDPWLVEHRTCPMCKMDILKHYGFVFTGSQESILQLDMDADETIDNNDMQEEEFIIRTHGISPSFIIQLDPNHLNRRHSIESNGSILMEFNEYQRYREQQIQSDGIASDALETSVATTKNHNPITAAAALHGREQLPIELRQRASISLPCSLRKNVLDGMYYGSNNCYVRAFDVSARSRSGKLSENTSLASSIVNMHRSTSSKHDNSDGEFLLPNEQVHAMGSVPQYIQNIQHNNGDMNLSAAVLSDDTKLEQYVDGGVASECHDCNVDNCTDNISGMVKMSTPNIDQ